MGTELHAILNFSRLTKGQANGLVAIIKDSSGLAGSRVADAQLHGVWFDDPEQELKERRGVQETKRKISVFITADNSSLAQIGLNELYRRLNETPLYGCEVVGRYVLDGNLYRKVA